MIIHASRRRVFDALTQREDLEAWWDSALPDVSRCDGLWPGSSSDSPRIRVVAALPDEPLVLRWEQSFRGDPAWNGESEVHFELLDHDQATLLTVRHASVLDDDPRRRDWPIDLRYLQAWAECGLRRRDLTDPAQFATITRSVILEAG